MFSMTSEKKRYSRLLLTHNFGPVSSRGSIVSDEEATMTTMTRAAFIFESRSMCSSTIRDLNLTRLLRWSRVLAFFRVVRCGSDATMAALSFRRSTACGFHCLRPHTSAERTASKSSIRRKQQAWRKCSGGARGAAQGERGGAATRRLPPSSTNDSHAGDLGLCSHCARIWGCRGHLACEIRRDCL